MLIQLLIDKPQMIGPILAATPTWLWLLLPGLLWLGIGMLKGDTFSAKRVAIVPVAMTGLSLWGTMSAFSQSAIYGDVLLAWAVTAMVLAAVVGMTMKPALPHDASYSLAYGVVYGVFSGIFSGRSIRLARLALRPSAPGTAAVAG